MGLLVLLAVSWLSARTFLLLLQVERSSDAAQLGSLFQQELQRRGLMVPRWTTFEGNGSSAGD